MYCAECGARMREGANFCGQCGAPDGIAEVYDFSNLGPRVVVKYTAPDAPPVISDGPVRCLHCGAGMQPGMIYCDRCGYQLGSPAITDRPSPAEDHAVLQLEWEGEATPEFVVADGSMYAQFRGDPARPQMHQMMLVETPMCFACGADQVPGGQFCEQCGQLLNLVEISPARRQK